MKPVIIKYMVAKCRPCTVFWPEIEASLRSAEVAEVYVPRLRKRPAVKGMQRRIELIYFCRLHIPIGSICIVALPLIGICLAGRGIALGGIVQSGGRARRALQLCKCRARKKYRQ